MKRARLHVAFFRSALLAVCVSASVAADTGLSLAQQNYILNCQGCHLADGAGAPGKVPRMTSFVAHFLKVEGGREFIVQVPGAANAPISDEELAAVMNWVLENFSKAELPPDYMPYTGAEIAKLRQHPLIDINATRAALIERIREKTGIVEDGLTDPS